MSTMMAPYDFRDIEVTPPNTTFTGTKSIKVGKTDLHIHEVGPGHTDGDAFVHVPDQDLVYAGDIL
ncbi:hypothetical protein, partial [Salmonella enterica]|uniref:hypothetical protein n=1 Tax=Salmonella enterica TaxID=28901 RepID=UPI003CE676A7